MKHLLSITLSALAASVLLGCSSGEDGVLRIEGGKVQGVPSETPGVTVYRGIPYAAAPVGDLRWKDPQPVRPWKGVLVADTFGPASMQNSHQPYESYTPEFFFKGDADFSEDCLYLNVWAPSDASDKPYPVAVWVHGGGFTGGWGHEIEMDGEAWAKRGVILVTINYRLGVFGFLAHPLLTQEAGRQSGNYGLLDQIAALRWVRDNISKFGGDPQNVTLFGQSAGARSIENLIMSDLTDGLFAKAIIMSGAGADTGARTTDNQRIEAASKEIFDWGGYDTLEKMRAASAEDIFTLQQRYSKDGGRQRITTNVVTDGYVSPEAICDGFAHGLVKDIPYMVGYTTNDLGTRYIGITNFASLRTGSSHPAYLYEFARPLPDDEAGSHPLKGAFHSSELWYVFHTLSNSDRPFVQADYDLSDKMVDAWTNFAKVSTPDPDGTMGWKPYTDSSKGRMVFRLDEDCSSEASSMSED